MSGEIRRGAAGRVFVADQQGGYIFRATDAVHQLVDPQVIGTVKTRTRLGHQAQVGRVLQRRMGEVIHRLARAHVVQFGIKNLELFGIGAHLIFGQMRPALIRKGAQRHELQTVTGRANLGVDLKAAL